MNPRWKKTLPGALALVLFVALLARTVRQLERAPALNADMLPAMALALEWEEEDPLELHRRTYELARAELPPERFAQLTGSGVLRARAEDPAAFHEHLPFFRGRVLYSLATWALHRLGAPLTAATYWIPLACYALSAGLFLLWASRHLPLAFAALFALGLAATPALLVQARLSTADGLGALLVCLGAWAWLERRSFALAASCLTLAIAARPDALILVACIAAALFALVPRTQRPGLGVLGAWLAVSLALVLGLQRFSGEYGWWPLIQISFVEKAVHPSTLASEADWGEYGAILARQLAALPGAGYTITPAGEVTGSSLAFLYAALAALGLAFGRTQRHSAAFLAALLAAYSLRFLLFPQLWDRFYAPFYALVPLCLLAMVAGELRLRSVLPTLPATPQPKRIP
ncbi:MAG: hypothetical protein HOP15_03685 [Planctomycetes bacterium]|nr:hypothetical protein [Planctomycetota bacterium]